MNKSYFKNIEGVRDKVERRPRAEVIQNHHTITREERLYFGDHLIKIFSTIMNEATPSGDRAMLIHEVGRYKG
jgi:hypothetical protein